MIGDLLQRYKGLEFHEVTYPSLLGEPDLLKALKTKTCPFCFRPLKKILLKPLYMCKSTKCPLWVNHGERFIVSASKVDIYKK